VNPAQSKLYRIPLTTAVLVSLLIVAVVGAVDYYIPYQYSLAIFYLFAIAFAVWYVNVRHAVLVAVFSTTIALYGDFEGGANYSLRLYAWRLASRLTFYCLILWLIGRVKSLQAGLETKVIERTAALSGEMAKRKELERELLAISEREQHRIGHELHDSLCQHLTGTALAGQVLVQKMAAKSMPEAEAMKNIVKLTGDGIEMARNIARGLFPVEFNATGLMSALEELAANEAKQHAVDCRFDCEKPVYINNPEVAGHLFRIAQEAVRNAVKHSHASRIVILFTETENGARLAIRDNGTGLKTQPREHKGMGLQIMEHRASILGAAFAIQSDSAGTAVTCELTGRMTNHLTLC